MQENAMITKSCAWSSVFAWFLNWIRFQFKKWSFPPTSATKNCCCHLIVFQANAWNTLNMLRRLAYKNFNFTSGMTDWMMKNERRKKHTIDDCFQWMEVWQTQNWAAVTWRHWRCFWLTSCLKCIHVVCDERFCRNISECNWTGTPVVLI